MQHQTLHISLFERIIRKIWLLSQYAKIPIALFVFIGSLDVLLVLLIVVLSLPIYFFSVGLIFGFFFTSVYIFIAITLIAGSIYFYYKSTFVDFKVLWMSISLIFKIFFVLTVFLKSTFFQTYLSGTIASIVALTFFVSIFIDLPMLIVNLRIRKKIKLNNLENYSISYSSD